MDLMMRRKVLLSVLSKAENPWNIAYKRSYYTDRQRYAYYSGVPIYLKANTSYTMTLSAYNVSVASNALWAVKIFTSAGGNSYSDPSNLKYLTGNGSISNPYTFTTNDVGAIMFAINKQDAPTIQDALDEILAQTTITFVENE